MIKSEVRKEYKARRKALTQNEITFFEKKIIENFNTLSLPSCSTILSYIPLIKWKEYNPENVERILMARNINLQIAYPRIDDVNMDAIVPNQDGEKLWKMNQYGIQELINGTIINPDKIDIILMPLLAFDNRGYRVGYGKGYYDRFLKRCNKDMISVGFSYFEPLDENIENDMYDVPLTHCITPEKVYTFA